MSPLDTYKQQMKRWHKISDFADYGAQRAELDSITETNISLVKSLEEIESRNAEEWFTLGALYEFSLGIEKDLDRSKLCFLEASSLGYAPAMVRLGHLVGKPRTSETLAASVAWYRQAAELGSASGMVSLGFAHRDGHGAQQNYELAAKWFKEACGLEYPQYHLLGNLYAYYMDMPEEGLKWYLEGEIKSWPQYLDIANLYADRKSPVYNPSKAAEYYLKRIEESTNNSFNASSGMLGLAKIYLTGEVCEDGLGKARVWLQVITEKEQPNSSKYKKANKLLSKLEGTMF